MRVTSIFPAVTVFLFLASQVAEAHVSISSGPAFAGASQVIHFSVGHGCENVDTYSIKIDIPAAVASVRALNSDLGPATVEKHATGAVASVTWQKADAQIVDGDPNYYVVSLRIKVPDAPFTRLPFVIHQTCKTKAGATSSVAWASFEDEPPMGQEPAAKLIILPPREPGWNSFTLPVAIEKLDLFFKDAQIVWRGDAAYSSNKKTAELITTTEGVTPLTSLVANDQVWVKY